MTKTLTALAAAATVALVTAAAPSTADARGGWWAPAIIGGIAAGAIVGSAFARPYHGGYGYYGGYNSYAPNYYSYGPAYPYAAPGPYYSCWRWRHGYRYRVC